MTWLIGGLWNKVIGYLVAGLGLAAAMLSWRYKISKGAREKLESQIRERTIERVQEARRVESDSAALGDDAILDKLRDNGWLRD